MGQKKKQSFVVLAFCLCLVFLSGCSKELEYPTENSEMDSQRSSHEVVEWYEGFTVYDSNAYPYRITIDADIIIPDTKELCVIEVTEPEFDSAYKEQMVKVIFDKADIYYGDDAHLPRTQVDKRIAYYEEKIEELPEELNDSLIHKRNQYWKDKIAVCEEARKLSEQFLDRLEPFEMPELMEVDCTSLIWFGNNDEGEVMQIQLDGYVFCYRIGIDGFDLPEFFQEAGAEEEYRFQEGEEPYSCISAVEILVTDMGVIGMQLHCPLKCESVVESVECLPIDSIERILSGKLKESPEEMHIFEHADNSVLSFSKLELGYVRVKDSETENRYSFIPAWSLSSGHDSYQIRSDSLAWWGATRDIYINAIDGNVIEKKEVL